MHRLQHAHTYTHTAHFRVVSSSNSSSSTFTAAELQFINSTMT